MGEHLFDVNVRSGLECTVFETAAQKRSHARRSHFERNPRTPRHPQPLARKSTRETQLPHCGILDTQSRRSILTPFGVIPHAPVKRPDILRRSKSPRGEIRCRNMAFDRTHRAARCASRIVQRSYKSIYIFEFVFNYSRAEMISGHQPYEGTIQETLLCRCCNVGRHAYFAYTTAFCISPIIAPL